MQGEGICVICFGPTKNLHKTCSPECRSKRLSISATYQRQHGKRTPWNTWNYSLYSKKKLKKLGLMD